MLAAIAVLGLWTLFLGYIACTREEVLMAHLALAWVALPAAELALWLAGFR